MKQSRPEFGFQAGDLAADNRLRRAQTPRRRREGLRFRDFDKGFDCGKAVPDCCSNSNSVVRK